MSTGPITTHPNQEYEGVAAEDLEPNTIILAVICPELMPNAPYGAVGAAITETKVELTNRSGGKILDTVTTANHIVAKWEGESNRRYPPMIRKGEPVKIWRREGQDQYRWKAAGDGRDFRTSDRVFVEVGASDPNKIGEIKDDTNTYSAYVDSKNKKVGVKTSKANGEPVAFNMEIDTGAGTFHISDDSPSPGNRIFVDCGATSGKPVLHMNLSTGITLKMEGKDLLLKVPGRFLLSAEDRIVFESPLMYFNRQKAGQIILNAKSVAVNTAKDFIVSAGGVIGLDSASTKIGGVLIAAKARFTTAVRGVFGGDYKPTTVRDPLTSPVSEQNNSPDTNMAGTPYT